MHAAFEVHMLNEPGKAKARAIAESFNELVNELYTIINDVPADDVKPAVEGMAHRSREWSIVLTKLEEACFFAKKAMARDPRHQA